MRLSALRLGKGANTHIHHPNTDAAIKVCIEFFIDVCVKGLILTCRVQLCVKLRLWKGTDFHVHSSCFPGVEYSGFSSDCNRIKIHFRRLSHAREPQTLPRKTRGNCTANHDPNADFNQPNQDIHSISYSSIQGPICKGPCSCTRPMMVAGGSHLREKNVYWEEERVLKFLLLILGV